MKKVFDILNQCRCAGIYTVANYGEKSLKSQLRYAQKNGAKVVIIVGEEELKGNFVTLKDMEKSTQSKVKMSDLIPILKETIGK